MGETEDLAAQKAEEAQWAQAKARHREQDEQQLRLTTQQARLATLEADNQISLDEHRRWHALVCAARYCAFDPDPDSADLVATARELEAYLRGEQEDT
jgi:hypothetical protein